MTEYTKESAIAFLRKNFIMELATVSGEGQPLCSVLLYAVDDDLNMYFATHDDSQKAKNLMQNPLANFVVWEHDRVMVQADVVAEVVEDEKKKGDILDRLADAATDSHDFWPPVFRIKGGAYVIFKLTPSWMRVLDLSVKTMRQSDPPFTDIIPKTV